MPQTVDTNVAVTCMDMCYSLQQERLLTVSYQSPTALEGLCYEFYQQYVMVSSIEHNVAVDYTTMNCRVQKCSHKSLLSYLLATLVPEVLSSFIPLDIFLSPATTWTLKTDIGGVI